MNSTPEPTANNTATAPLPRGFMQRISALLLAITAHVVGVITIHDDDIPFFSSSLKFIEFNRLSGISGSYVDVSIAAFLFPLLVLVALLLSAVPAAARYVRLVDLIALAMGIVSVLMIVMTAPWLDGKLHNIFATGTRLKIPTLSDVPQSAPTLGVVSLGFGAFLMFVAVALVALAAYGRRRLPQAQ